MTEAVLDPEHWQSKLELENPCHYGEPWLDLYADLIRKSAVKRIWPRDRMKRQRVLDVGCGDGKFGHWIGRKFNCYVTGIDPFKWPGAMMRLGYFINGDAVGVMKQLKWDYDIAVCVTSLPFMADWKSAVRSLTDKVQRVLVVDNLQWPVPSWQQGMPEKQPIGLPELIAEFWRHGFEIERLQPVNVIDRRLFLRFPHPKIRPFVFLLTFLTDWLWARTGIPAGSRYMAVLFKKI